MMNNINISLTAKPAAAKTLPAVAVFFHGCIEEVAPAYTAPFTAALDLLQRDLDLKKSRDRRSAPLTDTTGYSEIILYNMMPDEDAKPDPLTTIEQIKTVAADALGLAAARKAKRVTFFLGKSQAAFVASLVAEGCILGGYSFDKYKSAKTKPATNIQVEIVVDPSELKEAKSILTQTELVARAVNDARDLINESPSVLTPAALIGTIEKEAKKLQIDCEIFDRKRLEKEGYGGVLTVGKGAQTGPYMAVLRYTPKDAAKGIHLALVGKGITFDTGGLCLKSGKGMVTMKGDMTGAAVVFEAFRSIVRLGIPCRVTAIIPIAENAIGNQSYLPGEILKTRSGKTVFITNTDAEGRLILADALWQAGKEGATHIVDIATLTGAILAALGPYTAGLFCNDDDFGPLILEAGDSTGEDLWQMPLLLEQRPFLDHDIADLNNIGSNSGGSSITAALFLQEFVKPGSKWAHLDIASVDFVESRWRYYGPGATAFGVRTLVTLAGMLTEE